MKERNRARRRERQKDRKREGGRYREGDRKDSKRWKWREQRREMGGERPRRWSGFCCFYLVHLLLVVEGV